MFVILATTFLSMFDRQLLPPMLTSIAGDLRVGVGDIGAAVSAFSIAYAASQLAWSAVSARIGQVRALRASLILVTLTTGATAAFAWDPVSLSVGRALSGIAIGAIVPSTIVFVGDRFPLEQRARPLVNMAMATMLGMTVAVVIASLLGPPGAWRWVLGIGAAMEAVVAVLLWKLPAGPRPARRVPFLRSLWRVLADRWALLVLGLVLLEGTLQFGSLAFIPAALTASGTDATLAGLVTIVYAVAVVLFSQLSKPLLSRVSMPVLLLVGGAGNAVGFGLLAIDISVVTVVIAAAALGFAWAVAHTQMQTWLTDAVSLDRPVGTALFATSLFAGGAVGAALGAVAAGADGYFALFLGSTIVGAVFAIGAWLGRRRYTVRAG